MLLGLLTGCTPIEDAPASLGGGGGSASSCGASVDIPNARRAAGEPLFTFDGPAPTSVLFVVVDTFRRDALSFYGGRETTPCLAARGEHLVRFDDVWSTAPWTGPSTGSLMTGLYPENHGVLRVDTDGVLGIIEPPLSAPTFAGALQAAGWATALVSGNGWVSAGNGFSTGFDWANPWAGSRGRDGASELAGAAREWLATVPDGAPFFVHLQLYDNHYHYLPEAEFAGTWLESGPSSWTPDARGEDAVLDAYATLSEADQARAREWLRALYDAETLQEDLELERTLQALEEAGRLEDTLVVVVADHGESFGEEGQFGHGNSLRNELVRVPFLVYHPHLRGGVVTELVRSIDVLPTVLAGLGLPVPDGIDGVAVIPGAGAPFAYGSHFPSAATEVAVELTYVVAGNTKVVRTCATGEDWAFDLATDPVELDPRAPEVLLGAEALVDTLDATVSALQTGREYAACTRL
jgi:arylsulfatase A-like enzyme